MKTFNVSGNQGQLAGPTCDLAMQPRSRNFASIFGVARLGHLADLNGPGVVISPSVAGFWDSVKTAGGLFPDHVARTLTIKYDEESTETYRRIKTYLKQLQMNGVTVPELNGDLAAANTGTTVAAPAPVAPAPVQVQLPQLDLDKVAEFFNKAGQVLDAWLDAKIQRIAEANRQQPAAASAPQPAPSASGPSADEQQLMEENQKLQEKVSMLTDQLDKYMTEQKARAEAAAQQLQAA